LATGDWRNGSDWRLGMGDSPLAIRHSLSFNRSPFAIRYSLSLMVWSWLVATPTNQSPVTIRYSLSF
jgi:hypothetical protein